MLYTHNNSHINCFSDTFFQGIKMLIQMLPLDQSLQQSHGSFMFIFLGAFSFLLDLLVIAIMTNLSLEKKTTTNVSTDTLSLSTWLFYSYLVGGVSCVMCATLPLYVLFTTDYTASLFTGENVLLKSCVFGLGAGTVLLTYYAFHDQPKTRFSTHSLGSFQVLLLIASDIPLFIAGYAGFPITSATVLAVNCFITWFSVVCFPFVGQRWHNATLHWFKQQNYVWLKPKANQVNKTYYALAMFRSLAFSKIIAWWAVNVYGPSPFIVFSNQYFALLILFVLTLFWLYYSLALLILSIELGHLKILNNVWLPFEPWLIFRMRLYDLFSVFFASYNQSKLKIYRRVIRGLSPGINMVYWFKHQKTYAWRVWFFRAIVFRFAHPWVLLITCSRPLISVQPKISKIKRLNPEKNLGKIPEKQSVMLMCGLASPMDAFRSISRQMLSTVALGGVAGLGYYGVNAIDHARLFPDTEAAAQLIEKNKVLVDRHPEIQPHCEAIVKQRDGLQRVGVFGTPSDRLAVVLESPDAASRMVYVAHDGYVPTESTQCGKVNQALEALHQKDKLEAEKAAASNTALKLAKKALNF